MSQVAFPRNPPVNLLHRLEELHPSNFFTFEGIDGSGKSSLAKAVARSCEESGRRSVLLRLGHSRVLSRALDEAKLLNADPMTFNLLNWVSIYHETIAQRERYNDDSVRIFFDRYTMTVRVRGELEGLRTDFMDLLEARVPCPARIFLIDVPPSVCLRRIRSSGRLITYFEAGCRDVDEPGLAMVERSEKARHASSEREGGLLVHLTRMREKMFDLASGYEQVSIVDNTRSLDEATQEVLRQVDPCGSSH